MQIVFAHFAWKRNCLANWKAHNKASHIPCLLLSNQMISLSLQNYAHNNRQDRLGAKNVRLRKKTISMKISQLIKFPSISIDFTEPDKKKLQREGLKEVRWIPPISVYKKIIRWNLLSEYLFWWFNFLFSSLALISQTLAVLSLWTNSHSNLTTTLLCLQLSDSFHSAKAF